MICLTTLFSSARLLYSFQGELHSAWRLISVVISGSNASQMAQGGHIHIPQKRYTGGNGGITLPQADPLGMLQQSVQSW